MAPHGKLLLLILLTFFGTVVVVRSQPTQTSENAYTQQVVREVLATGSPRDAQGRLLELVRYTIPPNARLPVHYHPGMQIERVESGTLTYTVVHGVAIITRANGVEEILNAGQSARLHSGDSLVEEGGMMHYGVNETETPVILLSASLFEADKPKSILVNP